MTILAGHPKASADRLFDLANAEGGLVEPTRKEDDGPNYRFVVDGAETGPVLFHNRRRDQNALSRHNPGCAPRLGRNGRYTGEVRPAHRPGQLPENEGDGLIMAIEAGAQPGNMQHAFWQQSVLEFKPQHRNAKPNDWEDRPQVRYGRSNSASPHMQNLS